MSNKYIVVSGNVFGLVAVVHAMRAVCDMPVQIGGFEIPIWASWLAVIISGTLCIWAFRSRN